MAASGAPVRFRVRLTPRGGSDWVDGVADGMLRVRVSAPPVDGAANRALLRLIADTHDLPRGAVRLAGGESSRAKVVEVEGVERAAIAGRWPGLDV